MELSESGLKVTPLEAVELGRFMIVGCMVAGNETVEDAIRPLVNAGILCEKAVAEGRGIHDENRQLYDGQGISVSPDAQAITIRTERLPEIFKYVMLAKGRSAQIEKLYRDCYSRPWNLNNPVYGQRQRLAQEARDLLIGFLHRN